MRIRRLRPAEREALATLLDGDERSPGRRGGDLYRRCLDFDPSYSDDNVCVAVSRKRLLACAQLFPRQMRLRGVQVPVALFGNVFAHPDARGAGIARAVLEMACRGAAHRGMALALLFNRDPHRRPGSAWSTWEIRRHAAQPQGRPRPLRPQALRPLEPRATLAALRALHACTAEALEGTLAREADAWAALLAVGLPFGEGREDWLGASGGFGEELVAYGRATRVGGVRWVTEWGVSEGEEAEDALADLIVELLAGQSALVPNLQGRPGLAERLEARGLVLEPELDATPRLRCLTPAILARQLGYEAPQPGVDPSEWLAGLLPPARFAYWPSDRL